MASINKVILLGNLGRDPELRFTTDGNPIANITLATSESWKDKATGEKKEATEWHRIVFYGRLAEIVGEYLKKGSQIYVEGRLNYRKWTDKEGVERYSTDITATEMKMIGSRNISTEKSTKVENQSPSEKPASRPDDFHDDVPF